MKDTQVMHEVERGLRGKEVGVVVHFGMKGSLLLCHNQGLISPDYSKIAGWGVRCVELEKRIK